MASENRVETYVENMASLSAFGPEFLNDVAALLDALGYQMTESDVWLLGFCTQKVEQEIKNACNLPAVPEGLYQVAKTLIVAEFLIMKKAQGGIDGETMNFDPVLKELDEGDTKMVFAADSVLSAEQKLDMFIAQANLGREQFIRFRRLQW